MKMAVEGGNKRWTVVGVSGVTCGGKSTFAAALRAAFPAATVVSQDDYFLPPDDPRHTLIPSLCHINWEIASALDMDKMASDIREILSRPSPEHAPPLLIIEGFLIFTDRYISSLCDLKYFFILPPEECLARRTARPVELRDHSWAGAWPDVPGYFQQVVWPEYERHLQVALAINDGLTLVDGTRDTQSVVDEVAVAVSRELEQVKFVGTPVVL